jgi:hypothetical protein
VAFVKLCVEEQEENTAASGVDDEENRRGSFAFVSAVTANAELVSEEHRSEE